MTDVDLAISAWQYKPGYRLKRRHSSVNYLLIAFNKLPRAVLSRLAVHRTGAPSLSAAARVDRDRFAHFVRRSERSASKKIDRAFERHVACRIIRFA